MPIINIPTITGKSLEDNIISDDNGNAILLGRDAKLYSFTCNLHADTYCVPKDGITDATDKLQLLIDTAEKLGIPWELDGTGEYLINGTIYLGNSKFKTNGARIKINSDATYTQSGSANRKNEGVFLTKSSKGAGYGISTVSISGDILNIYFNRVDTLYGVRTAILLEQVSFFHLDLFIYESPPSDVPKTAFDLYAGCQNVNIGIMKITSNQVTEAGGVWIRNVSGNRATKNIYIGQFISDHIGADEALAIFNMPLGWVETEVSNVRIDSIDVVTANKGISVFNNLSTGLQVYNISFGKINIHCNAVNLTSQFGFKSEYAVDVIVGHLSVRMDLGAEASGDTFLVRQIGDTDIYPLIVGSVKTQVSSNSSSASVRCLQGNIHTNHAEIIINPGITAAFGIIGNNQTINNCSINGVFSAYSISNAYKVTGNIVGKIQGLAHFDGTHIIDTDNYPPNGYWFVHSVATSEPDYISYYGLVKIIGNNAVAKIFQAAGAAWLPKKAVFTNYALEDLNSLLASADLIGTGFFDANTNSYLIV